MSEKLEALATKLEDGISTGQYFVIVQSHFDESQVEIYNMSGDTIAQVTDDSIVIEHQVGAKFWAPITFEATGIGSGIISAAIAQSDIQREAALSAALGSL